MSPPLSDEELNGRILSLDNELIDQGFEPWQRQMRIESKLSQELQISYIISGGTLPTTMLPTSSYLGARDLAHLFENSLAIEESSQICSL